MATTKTEVNAILKEQGFGFVKVGSTYMQPGKKHSSGAKGIEGGSRGPMTSSSAHLDHNREAETKLKNALIDLCERYQEHPSGLVTYTFLDAKGKEFEYKFKWELFPTYFPSQGYDPAYQTYWFVKLK
mgnify:CR=1 FL=1